MISKSNLRHSFDRVFVIVTSDSAKLVTLSEDPKSIFCTKVTLFNSDARKIKYFSNLVLNRAIKKGGSSIRDFKNTKGKNGSYQNEFKVYQRENLNCLKKYCYGKIRKKFISKRSTFFCNSCQK